MRRVAIFVILLLAYLYYRSAGDAQLASIGLLSFAAIAQLAPAFFGGLIWRRATARGAIAGMTAGILVWAYTLLLPSFADVGIVGAAHPHRRALGHRRAAAAGICSGSTCRRWCTAWSGASSLNILCYIGFSLRRAPSPIERLQADCSCRPISRRWRRASGCGAPR